MDSHERLSEQYDRRFRDAQTYRDGVWMTLLQSRLQDWVGRDKQVLDLGCGWGEFVRNVQAAKRFAMDLNPDAAGLVGEGVEFLHQDCSQPWPLEDASLDVVFSSNFLEHLPDKAAIEATLVQARRCLRPGGQIILMGPNIRFTGGAYWDFWDHHVALTERSVSELLELGGFRVTQCIPRFMPYTMSDGHEPALFLVRLFLALPLAWPLLGRQFLVRAQVQ